MSKSYVGNPIEINIAELYRSLFGYVGAPYPALDRNFSSLGSKFNTPGQLVNVINSLKSSPGGFKEIMHVSLGADEITGPGQYWKFPYQPILSVSSSNEIIRRFPNTSGKLRGSIKERWSEDDDEIKLQGVFLDPPYRANTIPETVPQDFSEDMIFNIERLAEFKRYKKSVRIQNRLTELLGITHIAIEKVELGEYSSTRVRPFVIKGYSDSQQYDLLE